MATPEAASLPITATGAFILTPAALAKLNQDDGSIPPEHRVVVLGKIINELQKRIVRFENRLGNAQYITNRLSAETRAQEVYMLLLEGLLAQRGIRIPDEIREKRPLARLFLIMEICSQLQS
ncbi:hypothetical protein EST38_g8793 [Candolleomyces aberdarensis]|uniref:Uncharacterized protein n=1 Tax=Candolleomyces aberdarensis TaxID=2316362 RepID=A0A4Q2DDE3_9AGAR|nr:hypothetical protein EST38_g8793 [Candolleomyces aberdarensis]